MAGAGADVRSVEALRELHAAVAKFRAEAIDALAAVELAIRRAHDYLSDQMTFWVGAVRKCEDEVHQAKQELAQRKNSMRFDGRPPDTTVQEENLKRAKARLQYAHDKVEAVRRWQTKLPHAVAEVYDGPGKQLSVMLETDLPKGLALLERRTQAIEAYLSLAAPPAPRTAPEARP